jgi:hypothetical protein
MAEFCHTSNRLSVGRQRRRALSRLYFNSSATGRSAVGRLPVGNKGCRALGGSLQKDKVRHLLTYSFGELCRIIDFFVAGRARPHRSPW